MKILKLSCLLCLPASHRPQLRWSWIKHLHPECLVLDRSSMSGADLEWPGRSQVAAMCLSEAA